MWRISPMPPRLCTLGPYTAPMRFMFLLVLCLLPLACSPKVNINFGDGGGRLVEHTVIDDRSRASEKIALIDVRGMLIDARRPGLLGYGPNPVDQFVKALDKARNDGSVRGVVVRITSPGGTVTASDIMHDELRRFREETGKPVIASIGEVGASGGYYLALAADEIYVQPTSITGSIGVIFPTINASKGLGMIGIESRAVKSGPNKDLANPLEPAREAHYALLQTQVDELYARFRGLVIARRPGLKPADIDAATDGRVVTGNAAVGLGLADAEGGVREAYAAAKTSAGIGPARLVKYVDEDARAATTPYSVAPAQTQINLVQVQLGEAGLGGRFGMEASGFYYLWLPEAW